MPPSPRAPLAALLALTAAAAASADIFGAKSVPIKNFSRLREAKQLGVPELPAGCLYEGRWFVEGATVATREACLRCRCARGALSCARRACQAPPDPPPRRCHLLHRHGACCPELHCPDGVTVLEHSASARLDDDLYDVATPASNGHACVEGGAVFAAGSALGARAACEQCFCLGGARRCVRPRCLPPPAGCRPRPAPAACCPQRYYCEQPAVVPPNHTNPHDCVVEGMRVPEGERVLGAEAAGCTQCFCLHGGVRCQPLACAPELRGCEPLLHPGQCCPHQYRCNHTQDLSSHRVSSISHNALVSTRNDDRSLDTSKSKKYETTIKTVSSSLVLIKNIPSEPSTKKQHLYTSKVKRRTNDPPPTTVTHKLKQNNTAATTKVTTKAATKTTTKARHKQTTKLVSTTTTATMSTTIEVPTPSSTELSSTRRSPFYAQPEGTVKIMINGTINCTAELSHSPLNKTVNETEKVKLEAIPRVPFIAEKIIEAQSSNPVDIITDRNVNGGFDENETFTINVTSSLRTNNSHTNAPSLTTSSESVPKDLPEAFNISKKNKEDYDYDYTEPTLPPSLPNLKIIPFVAADAVVDENTSVKETLTYPALEREDKFPVYYPSQESEQPFATRREDIALHSLQHRVFNKDQYPPIPHVDPEYEHVHSDLATSQHEGTVPAALETHITEQNKSTKSPSSITKFERETPAVNLFSPPVETEGGFIPKGPGIIDEYYAVYPSTQVPPSLPHLTTSMQLDTGKEDCFSSDGRLVPEGDSISVACSVCACAWGELHCSPQPCPSPPDCRRRPATTSDGDLCCGQLICPQDNKTTTPSPELLTRKTAISLNVTKVPIELPSDIIPFDPPPDRQEPVTNRAVTNKEINVEEKHAEKNNNQETTTSKMRLTADSTTRSKNNETIRQETTINSFTSSATTENSTTATTNLTVIQEALDSAEVNHTSSESQEYEDEEEDEGFSFGSVLKLLLSDSYDATATPPYKKPSAATTLTPPTTTTAAPKLYSTTRRNISKPTIAPFIPLPNHHYVPPKKAYQPNTINRIDHLVLGEAMAIRKPVPRPIGTTSRPASTSYKPYSRPSSSRPDITTRPPVTKKEEHKNPWSSVSYEAARPLAPATTPGVGGLLKLAGCNIYGQMYRVGRIIAELSTPCEECRCTELGVTCRPLAC